MHDRTRWLLPIAVVAIVAALAGACGRKTDPVTPDSPRPDEVRDLAAAVRDNVAYLTWRIPEKNAEGKSLPPGGVLEFRVYRAEVDRDRKRPYFRQVTVIELASPAPAEVRGGVVAWSDAGLQYGKVYAYRVRAYGARGSLSAYSSEVRVVPLLSLAPPKNLRAAAGDGDVTLTWDAVVQRADGSIHQGFIGYNVYRGTEAGRQEKAPLNSEPLRTNTFRDAAVVNGKSYHYFVRAADSPVLPWRESLDSTEVSAAPRDMTPPAPPAGMTVVPGIGRVFLTWNENREPDLAGYHVYRSVKSGGGYERLTEKTIARTTYSDETVRQGMTYFYAVTAVDRSGNESARSREQKTYTETIR